MDRWMDRWTVVMTVGQMNGLIDAQKDRWKMTIGLMDKLSNGWTDRWTVVMSVGQMHILSDGQVNRYAYDS